jgi:hypothetical protein
MNSRFLCTEVVSLKLAQPFIQTKNDIGSSSMEILVATKETWQLMQHVISVLIANA